MAASINGDLCMGLFDDLLGSSKGGLDDLLRNGRLDGPVVTPGIQVDPKLVELVTDVAKTVIEHSPVGSLAKSFVDNVIRGQVFPVEGSIVHCSLYGVEHSGVYVGSGMIVELCGSGEIRSTGPEGFIEGTNAISVYVACDGEHPIGSDAVANLARASIGDCRNYNVVLDNCHQFACGCITGEFSDGSTLFTILEQTISKHLNGGRPVTWRVWDRS